MYGNYVIQNVLENGGAADRTKIIGSLKGRFCEMAAHKIARSANYHCKLAYVILCVSMQLTQRL